MLPKRDELIEAYDSYVVSQDLNARALASPVPIQMPLRARPVAIDAALQKAESLVAGGVDETSAVLFAFAQHPRCFPFGVFGFTAVIAMETARSCGYRLAASSQRFAEIIRAVMERTATLEDVAAWVAGHTVAREV